MFLKYIIIINNYGHQIKQQRVDVLGYLFTGLLFKRHCLSEIKIFNEHPSLGNGEIYSMTRLEKWTGGFIGAVRGKKEEVINGTCSIYASKIT